MKTERISLRVPQAKKDLLLLAAGLEGVTLAGFIRSAVIEESNRILNAAPIGTKLTLTTGKQGR